MTGVDQGIDQTFQTVSGREDSVNPDVAIAYRNAVIRELYHHHKLPLSELRDLFVSNVVNRGQESGLSCAGKFFKIADYRALVEWARISKRLKDTKPFGNGRLFCDREGQVLSSKAPSTHDFSIFCPLENSHIATLALFPYSPSYTITAPLNPSQSFRNHHSSTLSEV